MNPMSSERDPSEGIWSPEREALEIESIQTASRIQHGYSAHLCSECGKPVPALEEWEQPVEGGAGLARGHRSCIETNWGPMVGGEVAGED